MSQAHRKQNAPASYGVEIRVATAVDEIFLREMLYHSLHVPEGDVPFPRDVLDAPEIARYVEGWGRPGDLGFLAYEASPGTEVGAVWMRCFTAEHPGYGFVGPTVPELGMAVLPDHREKGIGSALLHRLLEEASASYSAVSLSVSAGNPARRLYERSGFEVVGSDGSSLTMVRPL